MNINLVLYVLVAIFALLGIAFFIWSFIDTIRVRSSVEYSEMREAKIRAAKERFKSRKGND